MQNVSIFRNIFKGRITNIESTVPKYIISTIIYDILLGVSILPFVYNFDIWSGIVPTVWYVLFFILLTTIWKSAAQNAYHLWCCVFDSRSGQGIQHYVIKFVSDLRQIDCFLRVLRFPPPIKLTSTI